MHTHDVGLVLQRLQQGLLRLGYVYVAGDGAAWPLTNVLMAKDDALLLVAVGMPERYPVLSQNFRELIQQHGKSALLVVGIDPLDSQPILDLFAALDGAALAYVDAATGHYHLRRGGDILDEGVLAHLLDPAQWPEVAAVDCREALRAQVAAREAAQSREESVGRYPPLTIALIVACVVMFLVSLAKAGLGGLLDMPPQALDSLGILWGPAVYDGEWWRLLTAGFLHGNLLHLAMNMFALYVVGSMLEVWQGWGRLGAVFLYTVVTSSLLSLLLLPTTSSVGASGGIFGLLGFIVAMLWRNWQRMPPHMRTALFNWLKTILPLNLVISLVPGINWAGHLGGLLGGLLLGLIIARPPFRAARLAAWEWAMVVMLLALTAVGGVAIIARLPLAFVAVRP